MRHMIFRTVILSLSFSLITMTGHLPWLPATPPASAEQHITLGQEKGQAQATELRTSAKTSSATKDSQRSSRKQHKLIRKPQQPTAKLVEIPSATSGLQTEQTSTTSPSATSDSTITQKKDSTTAGTILQTPLAVAPLAAPSTATSTMPLAGAISGTTSLSLSSPTAFAGVAAAGSSAKGTGSVAGRGLQSLSTAMPGLTQLITPATSPVPPAPPTTPTIGRNPAALAFSAVQNGANPAGQSVTINNSGTGTLNWTATSNVPWLTLNGSSAASGTNSGSFAAGVNISGLSVGTHTGNIAITSGGATNSPQSITVTLTITTAPTPTIGLSATSFSFAGIQGGSTPLAQTLTISNTGAGTLSWTVSENAPWLTLNTLSGTGAGTVVLNVNTAGMAAGSYSAPVTVTATGATNTPQTVVVTLSLTAPAVSTITLAPTSLTFSATQGGSNPAGQAVTISNSGTGTLSWSVSTTAAWLSLSPLAGTAPGSFTVTTNVSGLAAGTYTSTIAVTGSGATNSPQSIPVTLTITAAPTVTLNVNPASLDFTATQGAANPANQSLTVSSNTSWTVSTTGSWLTVTPTSASNNGTLTASVNTATATVGTNSGTITITGGGITRTVNVTLTLNSTATSSAILTWTPNTETDLSSYRVYRSTTPGVYGAAIATVPAGTAAYTATGLQVGNTYYFRITAVDSDFNESEPSNEVSKSIF